jgi:hypothetical protein
MSFIQTFHKHRKLYHGQTLGEAFVNYHWHGPLHPTQQKLFDEKDDDKARKIILKYYIEKDREYDGSIYDETTKT